MEDNGWTNEAVIPRLMRDLSGLEGRDIVKRQEAIVEIWLNTVRKQERDLERERCREVVRREKERHLGAPSGDARAWRKGVEAVAESIEAALSAQ
jgi:hypothetical protein